MVGEHQATVANTSKSRRVGKIPEWRVEDFQAIVSKNADAMIVLDREGFVLYVNPAAESLFNLPSAEMVGLSFGFPIILDEPVEMYILREFKDFVAAEVRLVEVMWAGEMSYLLSFRDLTDRIAAEQAIGQARDKLDAMVNERTSELSDANELLKREIVERKQAAEALRISEEKFRDIVEMAGEGIWVLDRENRVILVNPQMARMLGYSPEEILGRFAYEFVDSCYVNIAKFTFGNRMKGLKGTTDVKFRRKDGSEMWAHISASPRFKRGAFDGVLEMLTDVTNDKQTALKIAWLASFPHLSPEPIIEMDRLGQISYSNPAADKLFPDLRTAGPGHPYLSGLETFYARLHRRGSTVVSREVCVESACYEQSFSYHAETDSLRVYGRDITKRKQAEKAIEEAKEQAELYLDLMGHDINNLNQVALGYLELIDGTTKDENLKELISKPLDAITNSSHLIENVRKLQKARTGQVKTIAVDLNIILTELQAQYSKASNKNVAIHYTHDSGCMVMADGLIKDVFSNLIGNAIKHSAEVSVHINLGLKSKREDGREYCQVTVEDDGPGILDAQKDELFVRFQHGSTKTRGKGMGLYLVKTLVEGYHGRVWVEDRVKGDHTKGARFVVMLPAVEK